jgi:hypothetical protein
MYWRQVLWNIEHYSHISVNAIIFNFLQDLNNAENYITVLLAAYYIGSRIYINCFISCAIYIKPKPKGEDPGHLLSRFRPCRAARDGNVGTSSNSGATVVNA